MASKRMLQFLVKSPAYAEAGGIAVLKVRDAAFVIACAMYYQPICLRHMFGKFGISILQHEKI
jgi:hypothetical protein